MSQEQLQPIEEEEDVGLRLQNVRKKHMQSVPAAAEMDIYDPAEEFQPSSRREAPPIDITASVPLQSHRWLLGGPINLAKRLVRRPFLWMLDPITQQLNPVLNAFQSYFESHEERFAHTNRRINQLEQTVSRATDDLRVMSARLESLHDRSSQRFAELERSARKERDAIRSDLFAELQDSLRQVDAELERIRERTSETLNALSNRLDDELPEMQQRLSDGLADYENSARARIRDAVTRLAEQREKDRVHHEEQLRRLDERFADQSLQLKDRLAQVEAERAAVGKRLRSLDDMEEGLADLEAAISLKRPLAAVARSALPGSLASVPINFDTIGFEERFRGDRATILDRQRRYVPYFDSRGPVLDIGCGRGEFLQLLGDASIDAVGVDVNEDAVTHCRELGLKVQHDDAISYLQSVKPRSLAGIFCAQLVEHLESVELAILLGLCHDRLEPGGIFLAETLNPASLSFLEFFYRDPTHIRPVASETLAFLLESTGFSEIDIQHHDGVAPDRILEELEIARDANENSRDQNELHNKNIARLNARLFGSVEYSIVARKPEE